MIVGISQANGPKGLERVKHKMPKRYRIEIDLSIAEGADAAIIGLARTHYQSGHHALTKKNEQRVPVPVNEFIDDIESALIEVIENAFQTAVPHAEPHAFRCVLIADETWEQSDER
jgi:hypothetical protein